MKNLFSLLLLGLVFSQLSCTKDGMNVADEFVAARIGAQSFSYTIPFGNEWGNNYIIDEANGLDQINIIQVSDDQDKSFEIYVNGSQLHDRQLPYTHEANFQWIDLTAMQAIQFGPEDGSNYSGTVQMTFVKWDDEGYLEGTFNGAIETRKDGVEIPVKEGSFRVRLSEQ
ncbi:MAG: hypothetical protein AAFO94_17270 [Bacteroidota bacterium]